MVTLIMILFLIFIYTFSGYVYYENHVYNK